MNGAPGRRQCGAQCGRILLYSHDTFGLGHLRRSRTIAQALTGADPEAAALIVTGSPVAGRYDFPDGVDHVRLPGVVKLPDGDYASYNLGVDIGETVKIRAAILNATVEAFRPDLVIVDKEPQGFRNELVDALTAARKQGARLVLGLRDVLDDPAALRDEWDRKGSIDAVSQYDEIWVYGLPQICQPLDGLDLAPDVLDRVRYTGYLRRQSSDLPADWAPALPEQPYALITMRRRRAIDRLGAGGL
jgi:predicted glycosyltransferase